MTFQFSTPFQEQFTAAVEAQVRAGTSQEELAKRIGCSKNMVKHWKAGTHEPKRFAVSIERVLGIPVKELLRERNAPSRDPRPSNSATELLRRLTELELDAGLKKASEAGALLRGLDESIPDLMELLAEAQRHVDEDRG